MRVFNFKELVPNGHVTVTEDGMLHAVELSMLVTGQNRIRAHHTLHRVFNKGKLIVRRTPGRGNAHTKMVSVENAIELIMTLPGKMARQYRLQFVDIIKRYLDGDQTMISEIEENSVIGKAKSYAKFTHKIHAQLEAEQTKTAQHLPATAYVYATKSAAFPGLIKIGKAEDMKKRLSSLNTSCSPIPHTVVALAPSFNNVRDERAAHAFFADFRREGEFFELCENVVKEYFASFISSQYNREWNEFMTGSEGMCLLDE
jgi:hypothetical protein